MNKRKINILFGDYFSKGKKSVHKFKAKNNFTIDDSLLFGSSMFSEEPLSPWRKAIFIIAVLVSFAALFARLFHLQVVKGAYNRELADSNRIQIKVIHAPRGVIYDRNGKVLVQNNPGFRLAETKEGVTSTRYITRDEALSLEISQDARFKDLEVDTLRDYPLAEKTAHILGYVSEITEEELKMEKYQGLKAGYRIGRGGVEESFEKLLRGKDGGEVIEVDSLGKKIRTLRQIQPIPGNDLHLSIDSDLQARAYDILLSRLEKDGSCCGVLIIQQPLSGEILALVSIPSFNPADITTSLGNSNSPFLNRAIAGTYPPGSTFKIVSSLAGLESKKVTESTSFEDTGVVNIGPYSYANWYFTQYGRTEGQVDMKKALQRSNDIYYYKLGDLIGEKIIADTALKLGFGKVLGIDIPGEAAGVVPDNQWKVDNIGDVWYPGDTLHLAIGQGFLLTTPLQISNMISVVAANGKQSPPHLVKEVVSPDGRKIQEFRYSADTGSEFKASYWRVIKEGLSLVPKDGGTAWPFFDFPIATAGKTGTAEFGDPKGKTHAWYTSYAPYDDPRLAVTVLVEGGGEGSAVGGGISKEIYAWYFAQDPEFAEVFRQNPTASSSAKLGELPASSGQ